MAINIRTKGQEGEREAAKFLNAWVNDVRKEFGLASYPKQDELFQRNQNQSAVGGSDLASQLPLEIEIKRQEALSVNSWWKQCLASANRTGGIPILMFRQNNKKWRIIMLGELPILRESDTRYLALPGCKVEIDLDTFEHWFKAFYSEQLRSN